MAFSRKALKAMGLSDEQVETLIDMHTETVEALKSQIETYKGDAEKLPGLQKELEAAKAEADTAKKDGWKDKYDSVKKDFDDYKSDIAAKETRAAKETAYRKVIADAGLTGEKLVDTIIKGTDFSAIEMDGDKLKDSDTLLNKVKTDWSDYIGKPGIRGNTPDTPPTNVGRAYTREEIRKMTPSEINANWDAIKTSMKG